MSATTPPADAVMGMAWWNGLTERERLHWLLRAGSDVPADAWAVFKAGLPRALDFPNRRSVAPERDQAAHHTNQ